MTIDFNLKKNCQTYVVHERDIKKQFYGLKGLDDFKTFLGAYLKMSLKMLLIFQMDLTHEIYCVIQN